MDMDLDNIIVSHAYDGIADRFQISLELCLVFIRKRLVRHNDKFCTIAEFDISFGLLSRFYHFSPGTCLDRCIIDLFS